MELSALDLSVELNLWNICVVEIERLEHQTTRDGNDCILHSLIWSKQLRGIRYEGFEGTFCSDCIEQHQFDGSTTYSIPSLAWITRHFPLERNTRKMDLGRTNFVGQNLSIPRPLRASLRGDPQLLAPVQIYNGNCSSAAKRIHRRNAISIPKILVMAL